MYYSDYTYNCYTVCIDPLYYSDFTINVFPIVLSICILQFLRGFQLQYFKS